jgi:prepilin-type N-terminal cleavage/methylation domain-containing protein
MRTPLNRILMKASARTPLRRGFARGQRRAQRGFTMFEVLLVVVALGLLAALVIPTVDRFFDATGDTAKTHNAQVMNQYMETLFNSGVDTSTYTDAASAIGALTTGVTIPATVPGGQTQQVKLKQVVNAAAYTFTAGSATTPPSFAPKLGDRTQRP